MIVLVCKGCGAPQVGNEKTCPECGRIVCAECEYRGIFHARHNICADCANAASEVTRA